MTFTYLIIKVFASKPLSDMELSINCNGLRLPINLQATDLNPVRIGSTMSVEIILKPPDPLVTTERVVVLVYHKVQHCVRIEVKGSL